MTTYGSLIELDDQMRPLRHHRPATAEEWAGVVERQARWSAQRAMASPEYSRSDAMFECPTWTSVLTTDGTHYELSTATEEATARVWVEYSNGRMTILHDGDITTEGACPDRNSAEQVARRVGYQPIGGWRGEDPSILVLLRPTPEQVDQRIVEDLDADPESPEVTAAAEEYWWPKCRTFPDCDPRRGYPQWPNLPCPHTGGPCAQNQPDAYKAAERSMTTARD